MKVYSCPASIPEPTYDYGNYSTEKMFEAERQHSAKLKTWLKASGYAGANTGKIYSTPAGDGYAQYMYADRGAQSALFHLPYGDAWHAADVQYVPRAEILKRIKQQETWPQMFAA